MSATGRFLPVASSARLAGERDGLMLRAFEVENGLACNCICPGCRKALIAANGGLKVIPHFRHVQAEDCARGYKEGVRRAAIAVIANHSPLWLPAFSSRESASATSGKVLFREIGFSAIYLYGYLNRIQSSRRLERKWPLSVRSLQQSFTRYAGIPPTVWLRNRRLNAARRDLLSVGDSGGTVAEIAMRWSFWHLGRFSQTYHSLFGEYPLTTLKRGQAAPILLTDCQCTN